MMVMPSFQILDIVWRPADSFRAVRTIGEINPLVGVAGRPRLSAVFLSAFDGQLRTFPYHFRPFPCRWRRVGPVRLMSMTFIRSAKLSCILLARTEISLHVFAYEIEQEPGAGDLMRFIAEG